MVEKRLRKTSDTSRENCGRNNELPKMELVITSAIIRSTYAVALLRPGIKRLTDLVQIAKRETAIAIQ